MMWYGWSPEDLNWLFRSHLRTTDHIVFGGSEPSYLNTTLSSTLRLQCVGCETSHRDVRRDGGQKLSFTVSLMQNTRQNPGPKAFGRLVLEDYLFWLRKDAINMTTPSLGKVGESPCQYPGAQLLRSNAKNVTFERLNERPFRRRDANGPAYEC